MERVREKGKKDKTSFIADVKNIKENLKIREILRTVKMNSSMRLKAPPGSKVMDNKDFIDSEDIFEESTIKDKQSQSELNPSSATNLNVILKNNNLGSNIEDTDILNNCMNNESMDDQRNKSNEIPSISSEQMVDENKSIPIIKLDTSEEDIIEAPTLSTRNSLILTLNEENEIKLNVKDYTEYQIEPLPDEQSEKQENVIDAQFEDPKNICQEVNRDKAESHDQVIIKCEGELKILSEKDLEDQSKNYIHAHIDTGLQSPESSIEYLEDMIIGSTDDECQKQIQNPSDNENDELEKKNVEYIQSCDEKLKEIASQEADESFGESTEYQSAATSKETSNIDLELEENLTDTHHDLKNGNNTAVTLDAPQTVCTNEIPKITHRNRKLSLDHTMLIRRDGLSQSEADLHSIGKLPLERKSSFFRKKMDSFFRNTTELFKKQSFNAKCDRIQRKGSMSISLQSLNERSSNYNSDYHKDNMLNAGHKEMPSSMSSLTSSSTLGRSNSTVSVCHSEVLNQRQGSENSLVSSQPSLHVTHALGDYPSNSVHSLNEAHLHGSLLQNRAISMSSGLDSQSWLRRKKSSLSNRSNRVTWLASEEVNNYFKRMIQDENSKNIQEGQVYQDYSGISEHKSHSKTDSKSRKWSYQRAVSGEDSNLSRHQLSSRRRKTSEENPEISKQLMEYQETGVPKLKGFEALPLDEKVQETLNWAQNKNNVEEFIAKEASAKQSVIGELISTEADYLQHLNVLVELFLAAAHALQDSGKMFSVDTAQLFLNIPDIYNANREFWEVTFHPMVRDAIENGNPFNPKLMINGFQNLSDVFKPYLKYASNHPRANDYLRSLSTNVDFSTYLGWCHAQKECQRLQITDLLVKPIQRITKYNLLLKRIAQLAEEEAERTVVLEMDQAAKLYVTELNRCVKQRQELEKAENFFTSVENYDVDYLQANFQELKDEDVDEYHYQIFSQSNLRAPMLNCHSQHTRTVIHEGDLRFKDGTKEIEVRAILFTDLLLICKKQSKGSPYQYKMIRPKYMIDKLVDFPKYGVRNNILELTCVFVVMVDDLGSCQSCFTLSESSKDPNGSETLKLWEQKIKEAQYTYNLAVWLNFNPSYHITELELELASEYGSIGAKQKQLSHEDYNIEREAKERVATMMYRTIPWSSSFSTDRSHGSSDIVSMSVIGQDSTPTFRKVPGIDVLQNRWKRPFTGYSSRNSRMSSFQKSTSAASHDECSTSCNRHIQRAGSSVENTQPPIIEDDGSSSVTVKLVRGDESESEVSSTTNPTTGPGGSGRSPGSQNTLQVQNTVVALVHSLPDLSLIPLHVNQRRRSPSPISASDKLYQSHKDLIRNRLYVNTQYLTPDSRGSSYPPTSPGRATLKRGFAFSYPTNKPTLSKMGHVGSQGTLDQVDMTPSPIPSPVKSEKAGFVAKFLTPGSSSDKLDKGKDKEKEKEIEKEKEKEKEKNKEKKGKLGRKKKESKGDKDRKTQECAEDQNP